MKPSLDDLHYWVHPKDATTWGPFVCHDNMDRPLRKKARFTKDRTKVTCKTCLHWTEISIAKILARSKPRPEGAL